MIKAFVRPTGLHSRAMIRVAAALEKHAPENVKFVRNPHDADIRVLHVIGPGVYDGMDENQPHAIIQYCLETAGYDALRWQMIWQRSQLVWSYYDLKERGGGTLFDFYHAPLGVDDVFRQAKVNGAARSIGVMTSGYVSGRPAEAIEDVAMAADAVGIRTLHLGPENVEGMRVKPPMWRNIENIPDEALRELYLRTEWVSCLRYVEGFEVPALEGLMCGARPIVFDRADMRQWYDGHAVFVPELSGEPLVEELSELLKYRPKPVDDAERAELAARFDWKGIATGFWEKLL